MTIRTFLWFAIGLTWATIPYVYFIRYADVGLDLSDSGYYLLSAIYSDSIDSELRQFGPIWQSVFGTLEIQTSRIVNITLCFVLTFGFAWRVFSSIRVSSGISDQDPTPILLALFAAPFGCAYFAWHLFDFSYNSASFIFLLMALCPIILLSCRRDRVLAAQNDNREGRGLSDYGGLRPADILCALCTGFGLSALVLVKPQAALLLLVTCLLFFVLLERKLWRSRELLILFCAAVAGLLLLLGVMYPIKSPIRLVTDMFSGYESLSLLKAHKASLWYEVSKFSDFLITILTNFYTFARTQPFAFALGAAVMVSPLAFTEKNRKQHLIMLIVLALGAALALWLFWDALNREIFPVTSYGHAGFWVLSAVFLLTGTAMAGRWKLIWLVPLFFGYVFTSFGTNNAWLQINYGYAAFTVIAVLALIVRLPQHRFAPAVLAFVYVSCWYGVPLYNLHELQPYRLGAPLKAATVPVDFGDELGTLRQPPRLAKAYMALKPLRDSLAENKARDRPILIDMSGRAPGFALYLGLRPGPVAWVASGYPGSNDYLRYALDRISDNELKSVYVIEALEGKRRLSISVLNERLEKLGLSYPASYVSVGESEIPYMKTPIRVMRLEE